MTDLVAIILRINRDLERIRDGRCPLSGRYEVIERAERALAQASGELDSGFVERSRLLIKQVKDPASRHTQPPAIEAVSAWQARQAVTLWNGADKTLTPNGCFRLGEYHPYWLPGQVRNPDFDDFCRMILDLKQKPGECDR